MLIALHLACGCFCTTTAELSSCDRLAKPKIFTVGPSVESLPMAALGLLKS